jgi:hypothetical protein
MYDTLGVVAGRADQPEKRARFGFFVAHKLGSNSASPEIAMLDRWKTPKIA